MSAMPNEREHERATHSENHPESHTDHADHEHVPDTPGATDTPAPGRPGGAAPDRDADEGAVLAGTPVVVRRSAGLAALVGAAASAVAIAYLWRAAQTSAPLDWVLFGVMALIGGHHLAALVDARTPLLVADDLGVRIRLGHDWRGLPWDAVGQVVVHPRRGLLRDGRLVFAPRSLARALEGLDARGRRHVALNQRLYGAPLAVPLGTATRLSGADADTVVPGLEALTLGRAEVVELDPRTHEVVDRAAGAEERSGATQPRGRRDRKDRKDRRPSTDGQSPEADLDHGSADRVASATGSGTVAAGPGADSVPRADAREVEAYGPEGTPRREASGDPVTGDRTTDDRTTDDRTTEDRAAGDPAEPVLVGGSADHAPADPAAPAPTPRRSILGGLGTIVSRVAKGRAHDVDGPRPADAPAAESAGDGADDAVPAERGPLTPAAALRETRPALRAEATISLPTAGSTALDPAAGVAPAPEGRELRRPGSVDLVIEPVPVDDRVRPISTLGDPVEPLVIDDFVTEPAYDPVIGPELTAARTRLGMSVDDLAERTRIRPHVIESIEVDDFAPCGGDFYARGHLRTLARILGKDPEPLLATFEQRYATAPINARRVFEAELATGMTGSMRSTVGGPNWTLLVGVVLSLVLVWGVVRLFTADPAEMVEMPAPVLNGSAGVAGGYPADPPPAAAEPVTVLLTAAQADTDVVVRDGDGMVVFSGEMVLGERKTLRIAPPVRVRAADGGAVTVRVDGRDRGPLGEAGEPVRRTFR